jgi:hypothetical protein
MAIKEPWNIYEGYPVNCACETGDTIVNAVESLGDKIGTWTNTIGNSIEYTYIGNNVETAEYKTNGVTIFTQTFAYDGNNNVIRIITT